MRKKVYGLILCAVLLLSLSLPAYATSRVDTMDIQAFIYDDGSMYVTHKNKLLCMSKDPDKPCLRANN